MTKKKGLPVDKAIDTTAPAKKIVIGDSKPTSDKRKSRKTLSPGLNNTTIMKLAVLKRKKEEAKKSISKKGFIQEKCISYQNNRKCWRSSCWR